MQVKRNCMFKENNSYKQKGLFDVDQSLTKKQRKLWERSVEHRFFTEVFMNIDEASFSVLYSSVKSRPNVPVNQLIGSLVLKHMNDWTYNELFKNLSFNSLTRHAIGIDNAGTDIFAEASLFNFQNKLIQHLHETGEDLVGNFFDKLTLSQLEEFDIDTTIQRGDSFLIGSNIVDYSRLGLLIEVLLRFSRKLRAEDKTFFGELLVPYLGQRSLEYVYKIERSDIPKELEQIGTLYYQLYTKLNGEYSELKEWAAFERAYKDYFVVEDEKVTLIPSSELGSNHLLSPDDLEATFRNKNGRKSKGYVGHISETAHPDNALNLVTDLSVGPNNLDDAAILEDRLEKMLDKTPQLKEYHSDGGYGSPSLDRRMEEENITQITTAVRGRKPFVEMRISTEEEAIKVDCQGGQQGIVTELSIDKQGRKRWKVTFDYDKCQNCPFADKCRTIVQGIKKGNPKRAWYFGEKQLLKHQREQNYHNLPVERKKIRPNVEATVKEMKKGMNNEKVRLRGSAQILFYMTFTAIGVNLGRIHRHESKKDKKGPKSDSKNHFSSISIGYALRPLVVNYSFPIAA